jgi:hypothetical protein
MARSRRQVVAAGSSRSTSSKPWRSSVASRWEVVFWLAIKVKAADGGHVRPGQRPTVVLRCALRTARWRSLSR